MDFFFVFITALAALSIVVITLGMFYSLWRESLPAIHKFGVLGFITSTQWDPIKESFGAGTNLFGTGVTTCLSMAIAVPAAIGMAIFVSEIAPNFLKGPIGGAIELLAAIPSIIYGMWGLFILAPIMSDHIEPVLADTLGKLPVVGALFQGTPLGIDMLTASLVLAIMIIPFTASISRDAFSLTPAIVKESAYAMGATKWEVTKDVVIPYCKLGIFGGIVLSFGRSLGETMAVAFVLGNNHQITASLFNAAATITVTLANEFTEAFTTMYLSSLFYLALLLFVISFIVLAVSKVFLVKLQKKTSGGDAL
ncbi:MAG: phosphate ABC transporter permease subunit PstC [Nitrospiraceae bacterium]|nr:phosphate ABC transporter permease subunit PstC [Nitrospiraceae bacterium]